MKRLVGLLALIGAVSLSSCVHTASARLKSPSGEPLVLVVSNKHANAPSVSEAKLVTTKLMEGLGHEWLQKNLKGYVPHETPGEVGVSMSIGRAQRANGERFMGALPIIVVKSTLPQRDVDAALPAAVGVISRNAAKHYELLPLSKVKLQN